MINDLKIFLIKKEWLLVVMLLFLFVLIRVPGLDSPLHQDEYKWPMIVSPEWQSDVAIPHPPLSQFIYRTAGNIVGFDVHFRYVPLFFGTINLLLLYYFLRRFFGRREAVIGAIIWVASFFSVLASLMVDTDGQIMPFFFLTAIISYYHLKESSNRKWVWWIGLIASLVAGFFIKLSFLIAVGAIVADFLWSKKDKFTKAEYLKYGIYILVGIVSLFGLLLISKFFFPFFNLEQSFTYWKHFLVADRGWMQTFIQCVKALFYTSPLLILLPFFDIKSVFEKTRIFLFFFLFAFMFYIVIFDFSIGALDRYLQLLILPLTVMGSVIIASIPPMDKVAKKVLLWGVMLAVVLFLLQFVNHFVPSLHPKSEWIDRIMSLRWNFVYPFSGGSGPLGFYVSFLFLGLTWLVSVFVLSLFFVKKNWKNYIIIFLIPLGLVYNMVFINEYLFGTINGSAPKLLSASVEFIKNNPDIKMVTVYNDNGGDEIQKIGKYRKRLYTDPKFDINEKIATLNQYKEHYFVLDVPRLDHTSVYQKYLNSCSIIYFHKHKYISTIIYDCTKVTDVKIEVSPE